MSKDRRNQPEKSKAVAPGRTAAPPPIAAQAPAQSAPPSDVPPGVEPDDMVPDLDLSMGRSEPAAPAAAAPALPGPNAPRSTIEETLEQLIRALPGAIAAAGMNAALNPTQLKEIIQGAVEGTSQKRILENVTHPHISAYSYPEGDIARPKPKLIRKTYFCGIEEKEDRLSPGEIDAYNAIVEPREARGGAWRAKLLRPRHTGDPGELQVFVPAATVDQRMMLPGSLTLILLELNGGPSSADVVVLLRQIDALKAMLLNKGMTTQQLEDQLLAAGAPAA